jgi:predicted ArsR family transcriptional regulator
MIAGRSTRMEILELLRRKSLAAESISAELGITPNAVRQHLANLERDGLVRSEPQRAKRGRPALLFSLTERADAVFPKRYGQLASMVLQEVREIGGDQMLDEIFRRLAERHAAEIEPQLNGNFDARLKKVVAWIGRAGTLAEAQPAEEGVRVIIHNCPFRATALKFPQVCTITPHLLAQLLDVPVSQEKSIHRRDPYCSFVVQRPAEPAADPE